MALGTTKIRQAHLSDASALPSIERSALLLYGQVPGREPMQDAPVIDQFTHTRWMRDGQYLVAEQAERHRVGFLAALGTGYRELTIPGLAVRRAYQRRGLGRALLDTCVSNAASRGIDRIWLEVDAGLPWTLPICNSLHFHAVSDVDAKNAPRWASNEDPRTTSATVNNRTWLLWQPDVAARSIDGRRSRIEGTRDYVPAEAKAS